MNIELGTGSYWLILIGSVMGVLGLVALSWYFFSDANKFSTPKKRFKILYGIAVLSLLYAVFDHITSIMVLCNYPVVIRAVSKILIGAASMGCAWMAYRNKGIFTEICKDMEDKQHEIEATKSKIKELDELLHKFESLTAD